MTKHGLEFVTPTLNVVLNSLHPNQSPTGRIQFPKDDDKEIFWREAFWEGSKKIRLSKQQSVHEWFRNVAGTDNPELRIGQFSLEENLAFLAAVKWEKCQIIGCCLQALYTEKVDLIEFAKQPGASYQYYRLDFAPRKPGKLFLESVPHLHVTPHGPPRIPFPLEHGTFLPATFLEFIYMNHFPDIWLDWARIASVEVDTEISDSEKDLFDVFAEDGMAQTLCQKPDFITIRSALQKLKKDAFGSARGFYPCDTSVSQFNYHGLPHAHT